MYKGDFSHLIRLNHSCLFVYNFFAIQPNLNKDGTAIKKNQKKSKKICTIDLIYSIFDAQKSLN